MTEKGAETIAKGWLVAINGRLQAQHWGVEGQPREAQHLPRHRR